MDNSSELENTASSKTDIQRPIDETSKTAPELKDHKPRKKGKWRKRLIWIAIILAIIAFLINGIVARKLVSHFLNKGLEDQGMTGSHTVTGSLSSGFTIYDLDYTGSLGLQKISAKETTVSYQASKLIDSQVDLIQLNQATATIDIAKFKPSDQEEDKTSSDWKQSLNEIRPLALYPKININDLDLTILNNETKVANLKLKSLTHQSQDNKIVIQDWIATDGLDLTTPIQTATLTWNESGVDFDQLEILPNIALKDIQFNWENQLQGQAIVLLHDAEIYTTIDENTSIKLSSGQLDSTNIFASLEALGINANQEDFKAIISSLELNLPTEDLQKPIPTWNLKSAITIDSANFQEYDLKNTTLKFTQQNHNYELNIDGKALSAPLDIKATGVWTEPSETNWWEYTDVKTKLDLTASPQLLSLIPDSASLPDEINLTNTELKGSINTSIFANLPRKLESNLTLNHLSVSNYPIPTISFNAKLDEQVANFDKIHYSLKTNSNQQITSAFNLQGHFHLEGQTYNSSLDLTADTTKAHWINALAKVFNTPVSIQDKIDIQWNGSGSLKENKHSGNFVTNHLKIKQTDQAAIELNLNSNYEWPTFINIGQLTVKQEELFATTSLHWDGGIVSINDTILKRDDQPIISITGTVPYSTKITDAQHFFSQEHPWNLKIDTDKLRLEKVGSMFHPDQPTQLRGTFETQLKITGSPKKPEMNGFIDVNDLNDIFDLDLADIYIDANMVAADKKIDITGNITESGQTLLDLKVALPLDPQQWLKEDNLLESIKKNSTIKGSAKFNRLPLAKFKKLVPELEKIEGLLDATAEFNGTINEPKYKLTFKADLPIISLKDAGIDDIKELSIQGNLDEKMIASGDLTAKINGGKFISNYKIDLNDPTAPIFDIDLSTNHALIFRNDAFASRTNAKINLKGTIEDATLSGNIDIVESLFYKDLDLVPIGVPTSTVEAVELPSLNSKAATKLPIPAPFGEWKLNLNVKTADPILIRGNVGTGNIKGSIKVTGTLSQPSLDGTLYANDIKAKLPFSILTVSKGQIIFKPGQGLIPHLEIKGKSEVADHNVSLYIFGSAANPQIVLSSLPALTESDVMTLLATGSTSSALADADVAAFKTLQILLQELKQRNDQPGGNKLFATLLSGIEELDLNAGEVNQLTGEKFSSAKIKLHERWFLTAQLDDGEPAQTRGLIVFALRFN